MTVVIPILLGVMLLTSPEDASVDAALAARVAAEADAGLATAPAVQEKPKSAQITSGRSDFDRENGVALFERGVCVTYADDYVLHADRLYVFLGGSNELSRIVAMGKVTITNDTRVGECASAKFWKKSGEIELFGDETGARARLTDLKGGSDLQGSRIRFWLDSEQVDVEDSAIRVEQGGEGKLL